MQITAQLVKELRDQTGAGMMDCKRALGDSAGDIEKALVCLRKKGISKAAAKADRATSEGLITSYIHPGSKLGALVEINCETDFVARTDEFQGLVHDIAMHVAAANPLYVRREDADAELIKKEADIYRQQAINDGKPEKVVDRIVEGRIEKYYSEIVLMEQPFVKDNDKTIGDLVKGTVGTLGENIRVNRFIRFRLGE
jgi:elongation factor Ts